MKKGMKILSFVLITIFTLMFTFSFAYDLAPDMTAAQSNDDLNSVSGTILGAMKFIGYAIAVGMIIFIGIKYIMASADEKASLKSSLVRYVIGAVLIAAATTIASWVFNALKG